jgi:hypothetical protein
MIWNLALLRLTSTSKADFRNSHKPLRQTKLLLLLPLGEPIPDLSVKRVVKRERIESVKQ